MAELTLKAKLRLSLQRRLAYLMSCRPKTAPPSGMKWTDLAYVRRDLKEVARIIEQLRS